MRPKLLIWDWNGTILDDTDLCLALENELLTERGMPPITKEWYLAHFSFPIRAYYEKMGYTFETERFETVTALFMERYRKQYADCPLRSGVGEILRSAKENGMLQTLLSLTRQDDLIEQTNHLGTAGYFSEILGQDNILGISKADLALTYMAKAGVDPKDALFIGDTDHDAAVAEAAGCGCVLLAGGHQSIDRLKRCGVPVYESAAALKTALEL